MTLDLAIALPARSPGYAYHLGVSEQTDEQLARSAARGDSAAYEELVVRYQDRLYTLALRITSSDADARDCVQEGLISAWRAIDRFRGDARFSTWIYRIVVRKAYDVIERRKRLPQPVDELPAVTADADTGSHIDLMGALAALDVDFRTVIAACDIVGMSMDEAAVMLELPAGTVKSRLHRARGQLAQVLDPERAS
jgi:RNA polymerase sigma-70 factor (ECF subfamily)